jgi:group I intron endonuclease
MHTCPNNKKYVGITINSDNISARWKNGRGYRSNQHFISAINKYGWNNIKHEILYKKLTAAEAKFVEMFLISVYRSDESEFGYNKTRGGDICDGVFTDEIRKKMSESHKGKPLTQEQRKNIGLAHKGKVTPDKTKLLMSNAAKGRIFSKEHLENLSKSHIGFKRSKASCRKQGDSIKGEKHHLYGKKHSPETLQKMQVAQSKRCLAVIQRSLDGVFISEFESISKAAKVMATIPSQISFACNGKIDTAKGYRWEYADEEKRRMQRSFERSEFMTI